MSMQIKTLNFQVRLNEGGTAYVTQKRIILEDGMTLTLDQYFVGLTPVNISSEIVDFSCPEGYNTTLDGYKAYDTNGLLDGHDSLARALAEGQRLFDAQQTELAKRNQEAKAKREVQ